MKAVMDDFAAVNGGKSNAGERRDRYDKAMATLREKAKVEAAEELLEALEADWVKESKFRDRARFLGGVWIEQWLLMRFADFAGSAGFLDLRNGVSVRPPTPLGGKKQSSMQEIDIAFTDGYNLYQIECKAPAVEQGFIHKLEANRRGVGGLFGVGILTSFEFPESPQKEETLRARVKDSRLSFVYEEALPGLAQHVLGIKAKTLYRDEADWH